MELHKINLEGYDYVDNIYAVSVLEKEFSNAVDEPWNIEPPWKRYQSKLIQNLVILSEQLEQAIRLREFEQLEKDIYSIRHPNTPKNVRVIYTIYEGNVILLHAFLEKNDSDYKRAIRIAKKRLNSF